MKKILVPIDFSTYSDYALEAAKGIANKTNASLHLFHSLEDHGNWSTILKDSQELIKLKNKYYQATQDQLTEFQNTIEEEGINCRFEIFDGPFLENIEYLVDSLDPELIVMGSHGARHKEEWFLGSNTQKVVRKVHNNILTIKSPITNCDFKKVVFVTSLDNDEKNVFEKFLEFVKPLGAKEVNILTIDTASFFSQPTILIKEAMNDFKLIAKDIEVKGHFHADMTVEGGIRHFSEENNIDLIGISHIHRHPIKRIFTGSKVEMLVNRTSIPVLSLDF